MNLQFDPTILGLVIAGGVLAHLMLAASARFLNPLITLIGIFFFVAPWAAAVIPGAEALKYGRLYLSLLAVIVAVVVQRHFKMNFAAIMLMAFLGYYWLAAIWSSNPMGGLQFKAMVIPVALMGAMCVSAFKSERDLTTAMRVFAVCSLLFLLPAMANLATKGITLVMGGRFAPFGLNSNRLGHECASMLIICMPIALYDRNIRWKVFAYGVGTMAAVCVLASGSRAAVGQSVIAALLMGLPMLKRPFLPLSLGLVSAVILWAVMPSGAEQAYDRYTSINFANRAGMWSYATEQFLTSPIIGTGWVYDDANRASGATANLHSIYFQVLAELGIIGIVFFGATIVVGFVGYLRLWRLARQHGIQTRWVFTGAAFAAAALAHGLAESSTLLPGTINLLLLGMGFAMLGPLREMVMNRTLGEAAPAEGWGGDDADEHDAYADYGHDARPA